MGGSFSLVLFCPALLLQWDVCRMRNSTLCANYMRSLWSGRTFLLILLTSLEVVPNSRPLPMPLPGDACQAVENATCDSTYCSGDGQGPWVCTHKVLPYKAMSVQHNSPPTTANSTGFTGCREQGAPNVQTALEIVFTH